MIGKSIRERLSSELATVFRTVEGAIELAKVKGIPTAMPAAYVIPIREVSEENPYGMGAVRQLTQVDVMVVIVADDVSDPRGQAAGDALEALKGAVRTKLLGWSPEGSEEPITHVSGSLAGARDGVVWWEEIFATSFFLEAIDP